MTYKVEILRAAQKQLSKINHRARVRIAKAIRRLASDPRPSGCKKLSGRSAWRVRIGAYRVIYEIHDDRFLVLVIDVGNRKDIYR